MIIFRVMMQLVLQIEWRLKGKLRDQRELIKT